MEEPDIFFHDTTIDSLASGFILAAIALLWVVLLVRIVGLRSFSKMTSFDFVMTVAMGSLVASASQSDGWPAYLQSIAAMVALFAVQYLAARARKNSDRVRKIIQNEPVLLMRDGKFLEEALQQTRVGRDDLIAKLREANVLELKDVRAAVLETTGDVSVLHGETLEEALLKGVERADSGG